MRPSFVLYVLCAVVRATIRRAPLLFCALLVTSAMVQALAAPAHAGATEWSFEPVSPPPPPPGVNSEPTGDGVPLGGVGEISFWAPNRGLLITGGTESVGGVVPGGLYAYDGTNWHELASVCGGAAGRIAWAGPDEFWTIADQRPGQITARGINTGELEALSLCHFVGDEVVASYAMPIGEPGSYLRMDAAGCLSPSDCWFAGEDGQPPNQGSFHLHWNGSEVSVYYDSADHAVASMVKFEGRLYEGLQIGEDDIWQSGEDPAQPSVVRTVAPSGETPLCSSTGEPSSFCNLLLFSEGTQLPEYPAHALPYALGGFALATDGGPTGEGATQVWAIANPVAPRPAGSGPGEVTILHDAQGNWSQLAPRPNGTSPLPTGTTLAAPAAPVPGTESAWLALNDGGRSATMALLEANGKIAATDQLPESREDIGFLGTAGPISCPAAEDCWMATNGAGNTSGGWLFHLTDGKAETEDTDPLFDGKDGVISYRPPDSGIPEIYPDGFAEEYPPSERPAPTLPPPKPVPAKSQKPKRRKPLVVHVKSRFLYHRTLVLSFTLTGTARVQLVARERKRVVAKTRARWLHAGRHTLSLSFNPAHWPTALQFHVKPTGKSAPSGGSGSIESNETIST